MTYFLRTSLAALVGLSLAAPAGAAPMTAIDILRQFNVVVTGDLATSHDIEGRTVVGGNLTRGATFFNKPGLADPSTFPALTVYGRSTASNPINVNNGGGVIIQGTAAGVINTNGGGTRSVNGGATLPDFNATFATPLRNLSASLAAMTANSVLPGSSVPGFPNNVPIRASAGTGLAVFNITTTELSRFASFRIDLNGRDAAVFNVSGASYNGTANFLNAVAIAPDVIWNFTGATSLNFQRQWGGTVLAPNAAVRNSTPIEGSLFAASFNGGGELHSRPFVPVPEPAGLALFGLGAAAVVALRRRHAMRQAVSAR